jgi:ABC-type uncharacterized transport system involved in gliding motility auxiliary subunit
MGSLIYRITGAAGLILIVIGGIVYGIFYTSGWPAVLPLLAGLVLTVISFAGGYRSEKSEGSRRTVRYGIGAGLSVVAAAAIMIFLQTLSYRHSATVDLTSNRRFSLSPQTRKVLDALPSRVHLTAFYKQTSQERILLQDLLDSYSQLNPAVSYIFIDPDRDPMIARNYGVTRSGVLFVESGQTREEIVEPTEVLLTNAIARVTSGSVKRICFLTGHGEKSVNETGPHGISTLMEALRTENFDVRELVALSAEEIPYDCDILIIAGPENDIVRHEQNVILDYLTGGGRALFLLDPMTEIASIEGILAAYGILLGNDVVVDRYGKLLAGNFLTPVVNSYGDHPITDGFRHFTFFPQARSVTAVEDPPPSLEVTVIGRTNEGAYSETDMSTLLEGQTQYEPSEDQKGPIDIAVSSVMNPPSPGESGAARSQPESRVVVFGDSDFAGNSNIRLSGNRDLLLNAVQYLAEAEDMIAIRPADDLQQPVLLTATQGRFVFWIPVIAMPALVLLSGAVILTWRKRTVR